MLGWLNRRMLSPPSFLRLAPLILVSGACLPTVCAAADPRLDAWLGEASGRYARIFQSDAAKAAGTASTTWSRGSGNQSIPAYAGVTQVSYSNDWVYVRSTGLGYHVMGPWYGNAARTQNFPNFPANTNLHVRVPRTPVIPATKALTSLGAIGIGVDGVVFFDNRDAFSYSNASGMDAQPNNGLRGDGIWNRDAYVNEAVTFDPAFAHQAGAQYHYHANAPALRHLLGDNVDYDAATRSYVERSSPPTAHSPILGFMADGFPVYGPYGYEKPNDPASGVRRLVSGYVMRDGTNGTTHLAATGRTSLPAWAQRTQGRTTLTAAQSGPAVSAAYVLGRYIEDYDYLGDLGRTQGVDFDLDEHNGRFGVTPEFPGGTYAYFVTIEADGTPKFPYMIGRQFHGSPVGGSVTSVTETVTEYTRGAPAAAIALSAAAAGNGVNLRWNSAEGATYRVEASADKVAWTTLAGAVTSGGTTTSYAATAPAAQFRVTLTAIATYDTQATVGTPVGTTGTLDYVAPPVISAQPAARSAAIGQAVSFSVTATGASSYQWTRNGVALPGATAAGLDLASVQPADAGVYAAVVTGAGGTTTTAGAVLGLTATQPVVGTATLVASDLVHANGNLYDQILLTGTAATVTADPGQITRVSFIDLDDDIMRLEFSGAGALTVQLEGASGPAAPVKYNQPTVTYMKGRAVLIVGGANETTNLSVTSVGKLTAYDPTGRFNEVLAPSAANDPANNGSPLFIAGMAYDGVADVALVALASTNGRFGGLRAGGAECSRDAGLVGVWAPGVAFEGPLYLRNVMALSTATPALLTGAIGGETRVTGGDLYQPNGQTIQIDGITRVRMTAGTDSHHRVAPAQTNRGVLVRNGQDVTSETVQNP